MPLFSVTFMLCVTHVYSFFSSLFVVSVDGTHLGHNLPDRHGNRYCISKWIYVFYESLCLHILFFLFRFLSLSISIPMHLFLSFSFLLFLYTNLILYLLQTWFRWLELKNSRYKMITRYIVSIVIIEKERTNIGC